jgi:hypothetical protein
MGPIGGFPAAHFLDQLFKPGRRIEGSEIPLQSHTDGVADRSAGLLVQGLLWGLLSACSVLGHRHVPFRSRVHMHQVTNGNLVSSQSQIAGMVAGGHNGRPRRAGRGLGHLKS